MRILLIQPPFTIFRTEEKKCHPPLGLAYLAAALKDRHRVSVLDCLAEGYTHQEPLGRWRIRYGLSFAEIQKRIKAVAADVVAISYLFSSQCENIHALCRIIKEIDPRIITILGGAHPSAVGQQVLQDTNVDFVIKGEGEAVLLDLLDCLEQGKDFRNISGLGFKENNHIVINPRKIYVDNLDTLPFPHWDIFPLEKYYWINNPHGSPARRIPFLPVITSRGCPFECVFCSIHNIWGRDYRKRSSQNVLSEIDFLIKRYGVKEILFEDDNLTLDRERAAQIFQGIIERSFDLAWSVPNGIAVQTLDEQMLSMMKKSGCYRISIGVESGNEYTLKNIIKKPITLSSVKPVLDQSRKLGMETAAFFVVGFPRETRRQLENTLCFAENLDADNINFFFATPLPGTRLLELCRQQGLITAEPDFKNLKSNYPCFSTTEFSRAELSVIIKNAELKLQLLYALRHPLASLRRIFLKLIRDPGYFMRNKRYFAAEE